MPSPIIYITRAQTTDEFEVKRREWFRRKHSTDLVGIGFLSVRGYRCPTTPQNCNVYELPDVALLSSDAYMAVRKADTFSPTVMKSFTYLSASLYTQVGVNDQNGEPLARTPTIRGPVLAMLNFDCADSADSIHAWFGRTVLDRHRGVSGVRTIRLWEQRDPHPLFPPKEPRWCAVIEWEHDPGAEASRLHRAGEDKSIELDNIRADIGTKWHGLVRDDIFEA
jgi:hypothetical protein